MKITLKMVHEFNSILSSDGAVFRIELQDGTSGNPIATIVPANDKYIDSYIINPTDEFYSLLDDFFKEKEIELTYNNTKSTFWSESGWGVSE